MVDYTNPTTQFHPYQPMDATPVSARPTSGITSFLNRIGRSSGMLRNSSMSGGVTRARDYVNANPGRVLGGLAALVIGAGMMKQRSLNLHRGSLSSR